MVPNLSCDQKCHNLHQPLNWALHFPFHLSPPPPTFFVKHSKKYLQKETQVVHFQTKIKRSTKDKTPSKSCLQLTWPLVGWQFPDQPRPGGQHLWCHSPTAALLRAGQGRAVRCFLLISQPFGAPRCFNYRGKGANDSAHMSPFHTNKSPHRPMQLCGIATVPPKRMLSSLITILNPSVSVLIQGTPAGTAVPGKYSI